ncbi:MAG: PhnD/SsuA/transferrin family substrate-binding protein [Terracidiphilus sp.]
MESSERQLTRRRSLALLARAATVMLMPRFSRAEKPAHVLRVAISIDTLAGANVNDARAAYKVWISEVVRQMPSTVAQMDPEIFLPSERMLLCIRQSTIECFGVTALELLKVVDLVDPDYLLLQDYLADGMEYVLLVNNNSAFKKLADLRGAQILTHFHRDMVLAPAWLGTLMAANNLPQPEHFFASQTPVGNLNQVVLPVFFRRVDGACLARRDWETAVELNPQLGRDLRPLAVSPKLVPIAIGFRRGCSVEGRKVLIDSILKVATMAAGQQIVTLYQSHGFVVRPTSVMNSTIELLRQFERISPQQAGGRKGKL